MVDQAGIPHRSPSTRLMRLDVARGLALVAMAIYHFTWDLEFFRYVPLGLTSEGGWKIFARGIASTFLFLAGFSLVLGHYPTIRWRPFLRRLAMIVAAALVITVATYIAFPQAFIFFGILHAIAAASLIGLAFLRLPPAITAIVAVLIIITPNVFSSTAFDWPGLWWVGLSENRPVSNDYVPLFPWLGATLLGIAAARIMKANGWLGHLATRSEPGRLTRGLAFAGRHSLTVYLIHQPILLGLVYLASIVAPPPAADPGVAYMNSCVPSCSATQSETFCQSFCGCTLDALNAADLFDDLIAGTLDPAGDPRAVEIANQCTADIFGGQR